MTSATYSIVVGAMPELKITIDGAIGPKTKDVANNYDNIFIFVPHITD